MLAAPTDHNKPIGEEKGKVHERVMFSVSPSVWDVLTLIAPRILLERCSILNPATLLSTKDDGDPHNYMDVISCSSKPRPDLSESSFQL